MKVLQLTTNDQKSSLIQSCAGPDLTNFWEKEARIRWTSVAGDNPVPAHTYEEIIKASKDTILKYISRDRAIIDLLHIPQGDKNIIEFLSMVEDQAGLCRVEEVPITEDDLKRMALIAGFKDRTLAEKCLGEEYDLKQVVATAITRESSKANAEAVKVQENSSTGVKKVAQVGEDMEDTISRLQGELEDIKKVQKRGKYSGQSKRPCQNCTFEHDKEGKCPAVGRECRRCGLEGHFSRSTLCKGKTTQSSSTTRRVEDSDLPANYDEANYSTDEEEVTISRVEESRIWPGVKHNIKTVHSLRKLAGGKEDRWVELKMGRNQMRLYALRIPGPSSPSSSRPCTRATWGSWWQQTPGLGPGGAGSHWM